MLEVAELVAASDSFDCRGPDVHSVAFCELEEQSRTDGSFQVQMQLHLRHANQHVPCREHTWDLCVGHRSATVPEARTPR